MPNLSLGQRVGRGSVKGDRVSVVVPTDTIEILENIAMKQRVSVSLLMVELVERGLRDLAKAPQSRMMFLSPEEVTALKSF